jgi:arginine/lysine/ornithine decarboxylase
VRQVINLTQTTSGSYLLLASLDIARKNLALNGRAVFRRVKELAEYARREIEQIGGYAVFSKDLVNGTTVYDFDETKLSVNTLGIGLAGIEVYDILRDDYEIQVEFGDIGNILAYISIGDTMKNVERLVSALSEIRRLHQRPKAGLLETEYIPPEVVLSPQEAFYAEKAAVPIEKAGGTVSAETVMSYPPGIPILCPGERVTRPIIETILYAREKGCLLTGTEDLTVSYLNVVKGGL